MRTLVIHSLALLTLLTSTGTAFAARPLDLTGHGSLQSSVAYGGNPGRAIDANTLPHWSGGTCTHTALETFPYWSVDLGSTQRVETIRITNRVDRCDNRSVHPNDVDQCNPGTFLDRRWSCDANPALPAIGQYSCSSGWRGCVAGCNPGVFQGAHWRCPGHPSIPTGQGCPTGWERCDPGACTERLDGIEVWVGGFISDPSLQPLSATEFVGQSEVIRRALSANQGVTKCNAGGPVHIGAGEQTVEVDCGGALGAFLYVAKRQDNAILTMCDVEVLVR